MQARRGILFFALMVLVLAAVPGTSTAADVDVFAEGAYTATDLVIYIYANVNAGNLCSYGVKLNYDKDNNRLQFPPAVTKNEDVWYFGTSSAKQPYMDPDAATSGQVVFIGGKLDTSTPATGVTGNRVLLGKATFTRRENSMGLGTTAQDYFGITVTLGKAAPFANFVTTAGDVKDDPTGVAFGAKVRQRGDADGNGAINVNDITFLKRNIGATTLPLAPWADCDGNGVVNVNDITWLKRNIN